MVSKASVIADPLRHDLDDGDSHRSATVGAGLGVQKRIGRALVRSGGANLERQESRAGQWRLHGNLTLGCELRS